MKRLFRQLDPDLMLILALLVFGLVAYSNSFNASFHFDDFRNILDNDTLRDIANVDEIYSRCEERFLTFLSLAINYKISKFDPVSYHIFNFFIHYFAALFLYFLSMEIWKTPAMTTVDLKFSQRLAAFLVAGIFLLHPLQTQAVTYIIQRAESMAGMFYLGSILFYFKARLSPPGRAAGGYYSLMMLCVLGSAFSKETAITLPAMIVICELFFFRTSVRDLLRKKMVILLLVPAGIIVVYKLGALIRTDFYYDYVPGRHFSRKQYLLTQFSVLLTYLRLFFWPSGQNLDWDYPVTMTLFNRITILSLLLLLTLVVSAIILRRRQPLLSLGIVAFLVTLAPTSSFIPLKDLVYEHRMYLAVAFLAMGSVHLLLQGFEKVNGFSPRGSQIALVVVIATLLPLLAGLTYARNEVWQSELSLWRDTVRKSPNKARPHLNYGRALYLSAFGDIREAKKEFEIANRLCPSCPDPYHNLAFVYLREGDRRRALALELEAIKRKSNHRKALYQIGSIYKELKRWQDSRIYLERVISLPSGSGSLPAYLDLIDVYLELGLQGEAMNLANKLIRLPDTLPTVDYYRGMAFYKMKDFARAKTYFKKQTERDSKRLFAYLMLGRIYYEDEDFEKAEKAYRQAIEVQSRSEAAHYNLALILEKRGSFQEAVEHLKVARTVDPLSLGKSLQLIKLYGCLGYSSEQHELVRAVMNLRPDSAEFSFIKANGDRNLNSTLRSYSKLFLSGESSPHSQKIRAIIAALREDYPEAIDHYHGYLQSVTDRGERGRIEREIHRLETLLDGRAPLEIKS